MAKLKKGPISHLNIFAHMKIVDNMYCVTYNELCQQSIQNLDYRLINHDLLLRFKYDLTRRLYIRLVHAFRYARSGGKPYSITASTILRDSGIILYKRFRDNIRDIESALTELKDNAHLLISFEGNKILEGRRLVDVKYQIYPTANFGQNVIDINKHQIKLKKRKQSELAYQAIQDGKIPEIWQDTVGNFEKLKKSKAQRNL